jgi:hypothetical protein
MAMVVGFQVFIKRQDSSQYCIDLVSIVALGAVNSPFPTDTPARPWKNH